MLPKEIKPEVEKVEIHALKLDMEKMTMGGEARLERQTTAKEKRPPKKPRDPELNVPNDAFVGFRTAGEIQRAAAVAAGPSPGKELRERMRSALLSAEQEAELRQKWHYSGDTRVRPVPFDTSTLPFERGHTGSALRIPMHSLRHLDALTLLKTFGEMDESKPDQFDVWHARMSAAFNPELITLWTPPKDVEGSTPRPRRIHPRMRPPPRVTDAPSSTPPLPTQPNYHFTQPYQAYIPTQPAPPRPVASTSRTIVPPAQSTSSKLARFRAPPPPNSPLLAPRAAPKRPAPLVRAPAPPSKRPRSSPVAVARPSPPSAQTLIQVNQPTGSSVVQDPYNVLSSDNDEVEPPAPRKPAPIKPPPQPARKLEPVKEMKPEPAPVPEPDDSFSMYDDDDDDFDMGMSDSQLLRGAFIVDARSPKGSPIVQEMEIVDDTEDEG